MPATCGIYEALWLAKLHFRSARALYLHIPFCVRKCAYCDFASWGTDARDPLVREYTAALSHLLEEVAQAGLLEGCTTAYVGGGTPTLIGSGLADLVRRVRAVAPKVSELTCEANPDSLTDELLYKLVDAGCTRLSIGVQSLDDGELQTLGRIHTAWQAKDRLSAAVALGIDVSCDLMCALPGQTDKSWELTLREASSIGVGHVSVYPLQIEEGTAFDERYGNEPLPWNDTEVQARRMQAACDMLESVGFERYEVASYARPGRECHHNQAYWTAEPYLGLGCGASSMLTREAYGRLRAVAHQLPELPYDVSRVRLTCTSGRSELARTRSLGDLSFDIEMLTEAQACAEDLMLSMRMVRGAGPGLVEHARAVLGKREVDDTLAMCAERGLAHEQDGSWVPTHEGWLLGNELYGLMWGLAPDEVRSFNSC